MLAAGAQAAVVAWEEEGEEPSGVWLIPAKYGSDQKDGWLLVDSDTASGAREPTLLEQHKQARVKAEMLFCEGEM